MGYIKGLSEPRLKTHNGIATRRVSLRDLISCPVLRMSKQPSLLNRTTSGNHKPVSEGALLGLPRRDRWYRHTLHADSGFDSMTSQFACP